ncbi:MAG: redoxin domain-containing protein [Hyphomonadaceae bacterium]
MKRRLIAITGLAATALLGFGPSADAEPPTALATVENFTLVDQSGASHELYGAANAPAIVIATQVNGDPLSRESIKTLESLKAMFGRVEYLLLNSSPTDTRGTIAAEAAALNVTLPILDDDKQTVAESLGVTQTGEAFVIDPIGWKIVYHGPVNAAAAKDPSTQFVLFNALVYVLSHRPLDEANVAVKGTPIPLPAHDKPTAANRSAAE